MTHLLSRGIAVREGKILLAYYIEKDYWFLPGGHIEPGESGALSLLSGSLKASLKPCLTALESGEVAHIAC